MSQSDYLTATVNVDKTPEETFAAIRNVRGWWSQNIIGDTAELHDEFVFTDDSAAPGEAARSKDGIRFARFQLTEVLPGQRMVWHVVDSYLSFVDDHEEWTDTVVTFELEATPTGTEIHFVHEGLTATESECFEACSKGWTFYVTQSLPRLLATGTGQPIPAYPR